MLSERERVLLTVSCRDTDRIPKVADAGAVRTTAEGPVQVMHNGVLVVEGCYYGEWMTEIIRALRGHHEPQEEVIFHEIVERLAADTDAPTMMELGAFWAYYSLWMLERLPSTRAILVEPDPNNLAAGRANLALNRRHAEVLQAAVGAEPRPPEPFPCESDGQTRLVATESLASLLERFGVEHLDLLLVDVQGAETALLHGAADLLARRVRFLVVSTHHHLISGDPSTHQRCLALLRQLGAHIIAEHTVAESYSGDGLIAASFDRRDADLVVPVSHARAGESLFGDASDELAEVLAARDAAQAGQAHAEGEATAARSTLAEIEATTTWRLHTRLTRSSLGRTVLGGGSRAGRAVSRALARRH